MSATRSAILALLFVLPGALLADDEVALASPYGSLQTAAPAGWATTEDSDLSVFANFPSSRKPLIPPGQAASLTLEKAIETAVRNHPSLTTSGGNARVARARVLNARSGFLPQISLNVARTESELIRGASASGSGGAVVGGVVVGTGSRSRVTESDIKRASLNLRQTISDFGRTSNRVAASKHTRRAVNLDFETAVQDVVLAVEEAYFNLLAARSLVQSNRQAVDRAQAQVTVAQGFVEVGRRARFDLTRAQVDLSSARVQLLQSENQLELARVTLANAMGLEGRLSEEPAERPASGPLAMSRDSAIEIGLANRRDLGAAAERLRAAEAQLRAARAGYRPTASLNASRTLRGEEFPLDRQNDVSVSLDWNLFDGYQTRASIGEATGNLQVARGQHDTLRQRAISEIQQFYLSSEEARARVVATRIALRQSQENVELARARYQEGVGSAIEVTDAEASLANAETAHIRARYDHEIALARLQRAMGLIQVGEVPARMEVGP